MSTYSIDGIHWYPASVEQISYMEQARVYFENSRFIFDNGQIQIIPTLTKDTYTIIYPDDTYSYLFYSPYSKKNKLDFIRERMNVLPLSPVAEVEQHCSESLVEPEQEHKTEE